jgi:DNA invertase Pin-like site-specific DNA recombinase
MGGGRDHRTESLLPAVSSLGQRVDRQLDGITVQRTFTDTLSGKDTDRPQLEAVLGFVRGRDTVIAGAMDRLARNLEHSGSCGS